MAEAQRHKDAAIITAEAEAQVLATALTNAKINIVGGDGQFFDQFVKALALGHSIEGAATSNETMKTLLKPYLEAAHP
jgi:hypothetical protein